MEKQIGKNSGPCLMKITYRDMQDHFIYRQANENDIPFLVETIIEAEKGNTNTISYCNIFEISEAKLREILAEILIQDISDFEFSLPAFLVAEFNKQAIAACCAWIESMNDIPSKIIKANSLLYYLKPENITAAGKKNDAIKDTNIERTPGAIQIDSVYVNPDFRGKGLIRTLIFKQFDKLQADTFDNKAQVLCRKNNNVAIHAYSKAGFSIVDEKISNHADTLLYLPSDANVLMEIENVKMLNKK